MILGILSPVVTVAPPLRVSRSQRLCYDGRWRYSMTVYSVTLEIEHLPERPYLGTSPDLPGLIVQ